jgi:cephalosporin hydroxylase
MKRGRVELPPTTLDIAASVATFNTDEGFTQDYRGVPIWKTVDDLKRYYRAILHTQPEVIVETGTKWGGFAAWLADTFRIEVITIDIQRDPDRAPSWPGVTFFDQTTSIDPVTVAAVRRLTAGRDTMVTLDSDHHAPHVNREIEAYGPLVTPGCYLVVEDGLADLGGEDVARRIGHDIPRCGGPLWSIARGLVDNPRWRRDVDIENLSPISHHPAGWWIRR